MRQYGRPQAEYGIMLFFLFSIMHSSPMTRAAEFAGQFYEASAQKLKITVENLLRMHKSADMPIHMILVPHASHHYSGAIAAKAYATVPHPEKIKRIVLIGPYHRHRIDGIAISPHHFWETPLGKVEVGRVFASQLGGKIQLAEFSDGEHSLEVQLPFIQKYFENAKIVSILINDEQYAVSLANALASLLDDTTLLVISSDLHHYAASDDNDRIDIQTIHAITNRLPLGEDSACGRVAIITAMKLAQLKNWRIEFLAAGNSSAAAPFDKKRVVGYAAAVFYKDPHWLNEEQQRSLLKIARRSLNGQKIDVPTDPALLRKAAVFVTLRDKNHQLMGCIGEFNPTLPLYKTVAQKVIETAYHDSRFDNRHKKPQDFANIAISVLSPLRPTKVPDIVAGFHGVRVIAKWGGGTYLPEVAPENKWTKMEMLQSLCQSKSDLLSDCFADPMVQLESYTTQHFS